MVDTIEQCVYALVRPYAGTYLFNSNKVELTPDTDLNTDLSLDELEAGELMDTFFKAFHVERGNFRIETYYPSEPAFWNPTLEVINVLANGLEADISTLFEFDKNQLKSNSGSE